MFIGSANATDAAFGGNVEIPRRAGRRGHQARCRRLPAPRTPRSGTLLEAYDTAGGAESPTPPTRRTRPSTTSCGPSPSHRLHRHGPHQRRRPVTESSSPRTGCRSRRGYRVTAELLDPPGRPGAGSRQSQPVQRVPGVRARRHHPVRRPASRCPRGRQRAATVVRAELVDDPAGRLDEVLARQVDTPEKFLRFLALLLGLADPDHLSSAARARRRRGLAITGITPDRVSSSCCCAPLADRPDVFADLDRLVRRLQATERAGSPPRRVRRALDATVLAGARRLHGRRRADGVTPLRRRPVLAGAQGLPAATVEHVIGRFYGADPTPPFLVADETGLGRALVARGVIARTIERLQDDDAVDRIDVVYVCSNADIAEQNISRLDVTGDQHLRSPAGSRCSPARPRRLTAGRRRRGKPVNLVSFTPGHLVRPGYSRPGRAEERALLTCCSSDHLDLDAVERRRRRCGCSRRAVRQLSTGSTTRSTGLGDERPVTEDSTRASSRSSRREPSDAACSGSSSDVVDRDRARRTSVPDELDAARGDLIGAVASEPGRGERRRAGARPRHPRRVPAVPGPPRPQTRGASRRARPRTSSTTATPRCCSSRRRRTSRSPTPRRPPTATTTSATSCATPRLPDQWRTDASTIDADRRRVRRLPRRGDHRPRPRRHRDDAAAAAARRHVPYRTTARRRRRHARRDGRPDRTTSRPTTCVGYVALHALARLSTRRSPSSTGSRRRTSSTSCDGYKLGERLREQLATTPDDATSCAALLGAHQRLDRAATSSRFEPIDLGNARLRRLAADTVEPRTGGGCCGCRRRCLPRARRALTLAPIASRDRSGSCSRRGRPHRPRSPRCSAYEADRRIAEARRPDRRRRGTRLDYRTDGRSPTGAMTTLALFWPNPASPRSATRSTDRPAASRRRRQPVAAERAAARSTRPAPSGDRQAGRPAAEAVVLAGGVPAARFGLPPTLASTTTDAARLAGSLERAETRTRRARPIPAACALHVELALRSSAPPSTRPSARPTSRRLVAAARPARPGQHRLACARPAARGQATW